MRAFGSDDVRDAAHERMVALRIDIAGRLALERAERDLRLEAASASTTTACSRGGDARDDDAPATPTVTGGRARRPEAHVSARIPPGPAREQLKLQWVKLFHLAERFPRAAVTSRLAAVHALHDRTQAAIIAHRAAEEDAAAVLHDALDALVSSDHRVPDETHPTSDTSDNHQVVAVPSSTNRVAGSSRRVIAAEVRARDTKLAAFELNATLSCLVEAVHCEARAEVQMACAENESQRLGWSPLAASARERCAKTTAPRAPPVFAEATSRTAKRVKVNHSTAAGVPSGVGERRRPGRPKGSKNKPKPKPALGVVEGMKKAAEEKTRTARAGTTTTSESAERWQ